jgi:diguanylate cyclase (GGDEF)-like protein
MLYNKTTNRIGLNVKKNIENYLETAQELHILYIEDNNEARAYTLELIKRFFLNITVAVDGEDGLHAFKSQSFDVILTDIKMPRMNGLEMIKEIKKINPTIPILVLSAHSETEYLIDCIKVGIEGFLIKPLDLKQFVNMITKVIDNISLKKEVALYKDKLEVANTSLEVKVKERTQQLKHRLYHDSLTELGNYELMIKNVGKSSDELIFLVDIKGFRNINDIYGLDVGNSLLKGFAEKLRKFNHANKYTLYRVYGDNFVLHYSLSKNFHEIFEQEQKSLIKYLENMKIYLKGMDDYVDIDVSIGACVNEEYSFIKADMSLKHAKREHKQIVLYTQDIDCSKQLLYDTHWIKEVKIALLNDNIIPVYQGMANKEGEIIKYEVLMRLVKYENNEEKLISPVFFLDAAMKTQQYDNLTRVIVSKSFAYMQDKNIDFSINLSFADLSDSARVAFLHEELSKYGLEKRVIFELLEVETVSDYTLMIETLNGFRSRGVRIAIDDFGSGYSSFEHILQLNPDYIKIDSSLVKNILESEVSYALVKAIAEFSKDLNIEVIAEYVSSKKVFDKLRLLSIDAYQGYYFSIPSKKIKEQMKLR